MPPYESIIPHQPVGCTISGKTFANSGYHITGRECRHAILIGLEYLKHAGFIRGLHHANVSPEILKQDVIIRRATALDRRVTGIAANVEETVQLLHREILP